MDPLKGSDKNKEKEILIEVENAPGEDVLALNERVFIDVMTGIMQYRELQKTIRKKIRKKKDLKSYKNIALVNENLHPIEDMIHPLIHSTFPRTLPQMHALPMNYKFQRGLYDLYKYLRRV